MQQLPLGVGLRDSSVFDSFAAGDNAALVAALELRARQRGESPLWLWGGAGTGKTHLLQAACARAGERGWRVAYLPLAETAVFAPGMLAGLESCDLVCLDDVERVADARDWEAALFLLWNELLERGGNLLLAAAAPPVAVRYALADLGSRLRSSTVYQLQSLAERDQPEALRRKALQRGIELPDETLQYLLRRLPREFAAQCRVLDELDLAALTAQRRLTVPFVRSVLESQRVTPVGAAS